MRLLLILAVSGLFGCFGCKSVDREEIAIEVATYDYDDLDYPLTAIQTPDSLQTTFIENFFAPWKIPPDSLLSALDAFPGKEPPYLEKYLNDDGWYGENKKQHKKRQRAEIVTNANTQEFPNFVKRGIVISHTDLRGIPTNRPGFDRYSNAGEGYPFDYFQETMVWANTPIFIAHISNDKQWCYVICPYYKGWVSMHDVAIVDQDFIVQWTAGSYCLPVSDELNLQNDASHFSLNAKMGMVLPYNEISNNANTLTVYYANADENQNAKVLTAEVSKSEVTLDNYEINANGLKNLVTNLIGRPYGWGGHLENRDCSSMIRDLLSTYKLWLPRDSKDQIAIGHKFELTGTVDEKIKMIKDKGVPFLTVLRKKGHNMLYVGDAPNGEPLILHAIWGLKTTYSNEELADLIKVYPIEGIHQEEDGSLRGRHIIGEAVITSVTIGSGNNEITTPLIDEIYAMTNILEPLGPN